jgi:hypothetical protein
MSRDLVHRAPFFGRGLVVSGAGSRGWGRGVSSRRPLKSPPRRRSGESCADCALCWRVSPSTREAGRDLLGRAEANGDEVLVRSIALRAHRESIQGFNTGWEQVLDDYTVTHPGAAGKIVEYAALHQESHPWPPQHRLLLPRQAKRNRRHGRLQDPRHGGGLVTTDTSGLVALRSAAT